MNAIETEELTRRFGDVVAVEDLSLTVESGEAFGFLGPNGAGKSTTINMLLGFLEPTAGEARILGGDVTANPRAVSDRIGLLPEGFEAYRNLTGREHVQSAIETKGADDDPDAIIERVGLDPDDARRPASEYSTGMAQRMALAVALVGDPDLLILDEPSSGLDPNGVSLLRDIVREEVERGATVFFSSHILDEVEKVCDRVGILSEGHLVAVDEISDLRKELSADSVVEARLEPAAASFESDALAMGDVDGVGNVTADGETVRVTCERPAAKMRALRRLDEVATVADIAVETASLEAVFDEFTSGSEGQSEDDRAVPDGQSTDGSSDVAASTTDGSSDVAASTTDGGDS